MNLTNDVAIRLLAGERSEMAELQRVLESVPTYSRRVTGAPAGPADAQSIYSILPGGKGYKDKFVFGVYADAMMVGCVDLIRAYPDKVTAHLGLLLIAASHQHRGIGSSAYRQIERYAREWKDCASMRIGVVRTNASVLNFWRKMGYVESGEVKPYRYGNVKSETIILIKEFAESGS